MRLKMNNNMKKIVEVYHNEYSITNYALKKEKRASKAINN